jgi:hypothetical protein
MEHVLEELGKLGRTSLERRAKARQAADLIRAARSTVCQLAQNVGGLMTRILLVGYDPESVDFSDPALPAGMTVEKVRAGIAVAVKQFAERGWEADLGYIRPDETGGPTVERQLASTSYDCVVIGAGVRLPPPRLAIFEAVINAVHKAAPGAAIAFNTRPEDSADAAARWLPVGSRR